MTLLRLGTPSPCGLVRIQTENNGAIDVSAIHDLSDASSGEYSNPAIIGPAASITLITPNITPLISGKYLVWAVASARSDAASVEELKLNADGAQKAVGHIEVLGASNWSCSLFAKITVAMGVTHVFEMHAETTVGAAQMTSQIGNFKIMWMELGN
jgi:hypothetical protein